MQLRHFVQTRFFFQKYPHCHLSTIIIFEFKKAELPPKGPEEDGSKWPPVIQTQPGTVNAQDTSSLLKTTQKVKILDDTE